MLDTGERRRVWPGGGLKAARAARRSYDTWNSSWTRRMSDPRPTESRHQIVVDQAHARTHTWGQTRPDRTTSVVHRSLIHTYRQTDRQCVTGPVVFTSVLVYFTRKKLFTAVGYFLLTTAGTEVHKSIEITENN